MKTTTETWTRFAAFALTALVLLQLVWGGVWLFLTDEPEPTQLAEGSLQVDEILHGAPLRDELSQSLAARPVFWKGRGKFVPEERAKKGRNNDLAPRNSNIDDVVLKGTYSAGDKSGVIVSYKQDRRRLQRDEQIAGWTFTTLSDSGAAFENGDATQVLVLEHAKPGPGTKRKRVPELGQDQLNSQVEEGNQEQSVKKDETTNQNHTGE